MKTWLISLAACLAVLARGSSKSTQPDVKDYQAEILKLYQDIGNEDTHDFVRKDFPFADTKYFTEPRVVAKFMTAWKDGFLDKEGYFNLYSYKNRHDTYRLFDIFYYAKDFETFIKIAKWAKSELNPLQFVHAFTAAIYQRKDTEGVLPPPFYEVLPSYFTPSHVMTSAYKAMIHDVKYRKFEVNQTGYEYSWYKEQPLDPFKYGPKYNEYDLESRTSYFREDVGLSDWYSKFFLQVAPWLSDEKYPDINWERRGEYIYTVTKSILGLYNLERYASGLPPVEPLIFKYPLKTGYNPQLSNIQGRPLLPRPDGLNPFETNPFGVEYLKNMYQRYLGEAESMSMFNPLDNTYLNISGVEGFEEFTKIFYGISHPALRKYYRPLYYQALETLDSAVRSSNDVGYTGSPLGNYLTELRDPAFYQILAYLDGIFQSYNYRKPSYLKKEVDFPGVKISSFETTKLETFFERYDYDISNGVPTKGDTGKYKYLVSKWRINHKPYTFKMNIKSDKDVDAMVKIFFAPKYDSNFRPYGFNAFTKFGVLSEMFTVKLKSGTNTIEHKSSTSHQFKEPPRLKHILEDLHRAQQSGNPLYYPSYFLEAFPSNLALPRGSREGTYFQIMAVVQPMNSGHVDSDVNDPTVNQEYDPTKFIYFPLDRPVTESSLDTPNIYFSEMVVYDSTNYQA